MEKTLLNRDIFAGHVKDALNAFYDPVRLQTHILTKLLIADDVPVSMRGQSLRQLLTQAIESLRPNEEIPFGRPEWISYRLMYLRYVESRDREEVCSELALSRSSYYRYHHQALTAMVDLLWASYQEMNVQSEKLDRPLTRLERVRQEGVRLAESAPRQAVDMGGVVRTAVSTVRALAQEKGIELVLELCENLPDGYGEVAILRQVFVNVLTASLSWALENKLALRSLVGRQDVIWRIGKLKAQARGAFSTSAELALAGAILEVYGGYLRCELAGVDACEFLFSTPNAAQAKILIIDDDPDAGVLYRRYLGERYQVRVVTRAGEAWSLIEEERPDFIILDVLMPREDGWGILQRLRLMPETSEIPVIICSVLSQPQLAFSLGASEVLQKPIDRQTLLLTLRRFLEPVGSRG